MQAKTFGARRTFRWTFLIVSMLLTAAHSLGADFNGDGRDDIITFLRDGSGGNDRGYVYVALSNGYGFGAGARWHDFFCVGLEIPVTGDFNGDGRDDIACFVRDTKTDAGRGDVYVALSTGSGFASSQKWHEYFCIGNEIPAVGDFNGDGRDDIVTFVRNTKSGNDSADVYVALSTGSAFGAGVKWHDYFCIGYEIPAVGDFNGDGKDDIVTFVRDTKTGTERGDVWVAVSTGLAFGAGAKWHDYFCIGNELPLVGDFNGDGKDDLASLVRDAGSGTAQGDVYVTLSSGSTFSGTAVKWHNFFCVGNEIPTAGDFSGDGKADLATFIHDTKPGTERGKVYVTKSTGVAFGTGVKWHDFFCIQDEVPVAMAAVFPEFVFAISKEDSDSHFVGYASDEAERFWDNVWDFKQEFQSSWSCTQYYWGERRFLKEDHLDFVDSADLAFLSGHGSAASMSFSSTERCNFTECSWGSWSSCRRTGDLEYIAFESCQVVSLDGDWRARWQSTPNRKRPFAGLHVACGFKNNHMESPVFEVSDEFAENLEAGYSVRWAWLEATDDENTWVWGHDNLGCVIYVRPHRDETAWQHSARDRWHHDSDYILDASYWTY
jgi:hypothetical protein